jgi:hypothetical protein
MNSRAQRLPVLRMRFFARHSMPIRALETAFCLPAVETIAAIGHALVTTMWGAELV